jgi:hypothetical protein
VFLRRPFDRPAQSLNFGLNGPSPRANRAAIQSGRKVYCDLELFGSGCRIRNCRAAAFFVKSPLGWFPIIMVQCQCALLVESSLFLLTKLWEPTIFPWYYCLVADRSGYICPLRLVRENG